MAAFISRRPLSFALLLTLALELLLLACLLAGRTLAPNVPITAFDLPIMLLNGLFAAALLTGLRWWRAAGFTAPRTWRDLHLLIVPALVLLIPALLIRPQLPAAGKLVPLVIVTLLIGFQEEAIYRGILLRAMQPRGIIRAVMLSALLFGLIHVNSLLVGRDLVFVLAQVVASILGGFGLGALRVRLNTIWPLVLLHAANDFLQFTATSGIAAQQVPLYLPLLKVGLSSLMALYGAYLLRHEWSRAAALPRHGEARSA